MSNKQQPGKENPLLSRNIPPPPARPVSETGSAEQPAASAQIQEHPQHLGEGEALASVQLCLYVTLALDDKLEDMRREYKQRTGGRKIGKSEIMRRLIEKASVKDLF